MSLHDSMRSITPGMHNAFAVTDTVATGGQPTAADLQALAAAGYRTVLDIRAPGEPRGFREADVVKGAGMEYVNFPIGHAPLTDAAFDEFRAHVRDAAGRPILVHCASGNRVGLMMIPWLVLDEGKSPEEAVALALRMGLSSPQLAGIALDYVERQDGAVESRQSA
jgi:uncharacterized protein (TIGR01244 family)